MTTSDSLIQVKQAFLLELPFYRHDEVGLKQEQEAIIQLPAGLDDEGQQVLEQLHVYILGKDAHYEIKQTPLFVRNLARGDIISVDPQRPEIFKVLERSGNLAVRIFRKQGLDDLEPSLTPQVEKLDGKLDLQTARGLSYSLHVNLGFAAIETLMDNAMAAFPGAVWYYGNVYDPADGVTPLNWWSSFINQI